MAEKAVLERLRKINAENQRRVFVSVGTLKAARSEIQAHIKVNGKGIMTDIVLDQLNKAIGDGE
ncbi:TPA: hypothetical protein ACXNKZ_001195 [Klebsiella pneumoniae]|uniref:hypothetical protein n=1 Tax=Klebsiella TaxID=570 RepID=UPI000B95C61F|nr:MULTISPECIES: hypothetical protein [Klebsiella]WIC38915.1 hypothetical protein QM153_06195 [Klebsiella pneumoniae]MDT4309824.1 hypothetical protein [Klebsiella aerogenes]OYJ34607.1 hypothetical protein CI739_10385 [Klebsiella pneumoniae subsp. pneumoniae]HBT0448474.1 hypothetical protein [Klebsiella pneumoniae]HBX0741284.1 hypothetical protein [Klebsiella pneumoniae]